MELVVGVFLMIVGFASSVRTILGLEVLVRKSNAAYKGSVLSYKEVYSQSQPLHSTKCHKPYGYYSYITP